MRHKFDVKHFDAYLKLLQSTDNTSFPIRISSSSCLYIVDSIRESSYICISASYSFHSWTGAIMYPRYIEKITASPMIAWTLLVMLKLYHFGFWKVEFVAL